MARVQRRPKLSVILPTLNEAKSIALLLAELSLIDDQLELIVVDGGSTDLTPLIAEIAGAKVLQMNKANRGNQLKIGAIKSNGENLLFLHADSILPRASSNFLRSFIQSEQNKHAAYFFNFKTNSKGIIFRLLEIAVFIRSHLFKLPYGDQGLLISRDMYLISGGYKDLNIMEDLEFIQRLSKLTKIHGLGVDLITDGKRWNKGQVIKNAIKNAKLRYKWSKGESAESLAKEYYSERKEQMNQIE